MNPDELCMGCLEERGGEKVCPHCQWEEGTPIASPLYLSPRTVLEDQYLLGRVLGHGGFGITYLAWDLRLHRRLAIKEYMPQGIAGRAPGNLNVSIYTNEEDYQWGLERFLDEARVVAKFADHPNVMSIINHFTGNDTAYIVAEYLDGSTLLEYTEQQGGTIPYETATRILMPVMDALREVHKSGILHRDISPDNICITRSGLVKLLDFGAARQALGQKSKNLSVILKEGYAPEEQYRTKGDQGPWTPTSTPRLPLSTVSSPGRYRLRQLIGPIRTSSRLPLHWGWRCLRTWNRTCSRASGSEPRIASNRCRHFRQRSWVGARPALDHLRHLTQRLHRFPCRVRVQHRSRPRFRSRIPCCSGWSRFPNGCGGQEPPP